VARGRFGCLCIGGRGEGGGGSFIIVVRARSQRAPPPHATAATSAALALRHLHAAARRRPPQPAVSDAPRIQRPVGRRLAQRHGHSARSLLGKANRPARAPIGRRLPPLPLGRAARGQRRRGAFSRRVRVVRGVARGYRRGARQRQRWRRPLDRRSQGPRLRGHRARRRSGRPRRRGRYRASGLATCLRSLMRGRRVWKRARRCLEVPGMRAVALTLRAMLLRPGTPRGAVGCFWWRR
jgi:hypothetical protein